MNMHSNEAATSRSSTGTSDCSMIQGYVAPGFEAVREEFERSFLERREVGAAVAVYRHGERVVDLWGGIRDRNSGDPWEADTMALLFSSTKGVAALVVALAHSRGWIDFDARVCDYWPEFAQGGKATITVRQLLAHQAGLCMVDQPVTPALLTDMDALAEVLARQRPAWEPGTRHGYHPLTIGLYQNELIRRVDPQHRTIGQILQAEITQPLGADIYIGLPDAIPEKRLTKVLPGGGGLYEALDAMRISFRMMLDMFLPWSLARRIFTNLRGENLRRVSAEQFQDRSWLRIEISAGNGVASARGMAQAYGAFARGDARLALSPNTLAQLAAPPCVPTGGSRDVVLFLDTAYSLGFWKPCPTLPFGRDNSVFGAPGAGGSFAFADPSEGLGFAYVPNRMGLYVDDPRAIALRNTLYRCLNDVR